MRKLYWEITITETVAKEFNKQLPNWIHVVKNKEAPTNLLEAFLDKGEASAIALALALQNSLLIIDEEKGRKIAKSLKLEVTGTLGIFLTAKNKGLVAEVSPLIHKVNQTNFRVSSSLVKEVLNKAGENK